jgi:hypothetical protein
MFPYSQRNFDRMNIVSMYELCLFFDVSVVLYVRPLVDVSVVLSVRTLADVSVVLSVRSPVDG